MARKSELTDPLELLLDTICNTFGGILFIALMVVILIESTTKQITPELPEEVLQEKIATARLELARATAKTKQQEMVLQLQASNTDKLVDKTSSKLAAESREATDKFDAQLRKRAANTDKVAELQENVIESMKEAAVRDAKLKELRKQTPKLETELAAEVQKRKRDYKSPKVEEVDASPMMMLVTENRICRVYRINFLGPTQKGADTYFEKHGEVKVLKRHKSGGLEIVKGRDQVQEVQNYISEYRGQGYYLDIALFTDSWDAASQLTQACRKSKLNYRIVFKNPGEAVEVVSTSGEDENGVSLQN